MTTSHWVTTSQTTIKMPQLGAKRILYFKESSLLASICMISDIWLFQKFSYIYYIMWDSMDMICIVLKKLTNWIFKIPIGPAHSIVPLRNALKLKNANKFLQYYRANLGQVNVKWESKNNRRGTNSHWRRSREVFFPERAILNCVKIIFKGNRRHISKQQLLNT